MLSRSLIGYWRRPQNNKDDTKSGSPIAACRFKLLFVPGFVLIHPHILLLLQSQEQKNTHIYIHIHSAPPAFAEKPQRLWMLQDEDVFSL